MTFHRTFVIIATTLLTLLATGCCGERAEDRDYVCDEDKPNAYSEAPPWGFACDEVRTNESRVDPDTGEEERHIHNFYHCCP